MYLKGVNAEGTHVEVFTTSFPLSLGVNRITSRRVRLPGAIRVDGGARRIPLRRRKPSTISGAGMNEDQQTDRSLKVKRRGAG